jgi:NADH-ubiquinone oxidoreductase chain 1
MTEHAAVIFVFFFLAEYASIVLICILTSILFLGGYLINIKPILYIYFFLDILSIYAVNMIDFYYCNITWYLWGDYNNFTLPNISIIDLWKNNFVEFYINQKESLLIDPYTEGIYCGLILGIKSCIMIFIFIWARASFPRIRFDQLMTFCWTILLPIVIAFIILVPCILYSFEILPSNIILL